MQSDQRRAILHPLALEFPLERRCSPDQSAMVQSVVFSVVLLSSWVVTRLVLYQDRVGRNETAAARKEFRLRISLLWLDLSMLKY